MRPVVLTLVGILTPNGDVEEIAVTPWLCAGPFIAHRTAAPGNPTRIDTGQRGSNRYLVAETVDEIANAVDAIKVRG